MTKPPLIQVTNRFHKTLLEKIDKLRAVRNKYFIDGKIYRSRAEWIDDALKEKLEQDRKKTNRELKKLGKTSEMIEK